MNARTSSLRRSLPAALVAIAAGAVLLPITVRSREIERRARTLNASFAKADGVRTVADRTATRRIEGSPREVFVWLREIEASPPQAFTIDVSIVAAGHEEPTLVAEIREGTTREMDR